MSMMQRCWRVTLKGQKRQSLEWSILISPMLAWLQEFQSQLMSRNLLAGYLLQCSIQTCPSSTKMLEAFYRRALQKL